MKKNLLLSGMLVSCISFGQTFSDNFDSYTAGSALCPQSGGAWTTWSNAPGGAEDVLVSSADAASGPNSLFFSTTAQTGGPTDLVRNFGVLNTGQFSMEFNIKVQTGKAGYFNFQKNATIGQVWAMDCFFADNGDIIINNQAGLNFNGTYPQNQWFNFRIDINFNANVWEVFIDNNSIGSFANPENQIASIDIYPTDQNAPYSCGYFIDDFQYTVTPYTLPAVNGAATLVRFDQGEIAGNTVTPKVTIRNLGTQPITSATINVDYNGANINTNLSGLNLVSLASTTITMPSTMTLANTPGNMVATISNVNGLGADGDANDNSTTYGVNPIIPAAGKMVVGEEGTGTWCQWCPRGAVFMDRMETKYAEYWAGIAVHNGDPMVVSDYDASFGALIAGYPSALVDRGSDMDPSVMENEFLNRILVAPTAIITNGATYDAATRTLNVSVSANFQAAATNNYKLAIVLTEDGVTGTSGYSQSNAYSGGGNGAMGGYESLPNPVPASQMVYDHVARIISPSFAGTNAAFPTTISTGSTHTLNANFVLPATWDENSIHIIGLLVAPNGTIDNAGKATIAEAVTNGYVNGTSTTGIEEGSPIDAVFQIFPNPATESATIALNLKQESTVVVRIFDMAGKEIAARNYGSLNGATNIALNTTNYQSGVYFVQVTLEGTTVQQRLIIE